MTDSLPDPLVPAEVDLRGLEYMPLLGGKLFNSDFNLDADDTEFRVGMRLWWAAWNQVPAGSLPIEDRRLQKLAGLEEAPAKWKRVRARALHGFFQCADGRLYHRILAEQALIAWEKRAENIAERENEAERQRRVRAERKRLFELLRGVGVTPKYDIKMDELRKLVAEHVTPAEPPTPPPVTPPVTVTGHGDVTPPVTVTDTAKTGRDGTGHLIQEHPTPPLIAARVALIARLKAAGIFPDTGTLLDPILEAGGVWDEFEPFVERALQADRPFRYLVAAVIGERERAAKRGPLPAAPPPRDDRKSRQLNTAALMTGAGRSATEPETIDADAHVIPPRSLG